MKKLIIGEKPSVAEAYANVLGVKELKKGYYENDEYIISWCVGHLVGMSYPEVYHERLKKWNIDDLPFLPKEFLYEVLKDVKQQFCVIKTLLNRKDVSVIYNATDSDREGQAILSLVLMKTGYNKNAEMKRIWIDSQVDEAIRKGIREAKPASEYDKLTDAALMRGIVDYLIGINFSRVLTLKYGSQFNREIKSNKFQAISVGRVMTCVLGFVVEREREIKNFKPTSFYNIEADTGILSTWKAVKGSHFFESPLLYNETGFLKKESAENFIKNLNKDSRLMVQNVYKENEKKNPPLLFNLAELQNECSKLFKISPDDTLEIVQKLYESKLTTYPRTDARVLSSPVCGEIPDILKKLSENDNWKDITDEIQIKAFPTNLLNTRYCDDSKITGHYAIIPTGEKDGISSLNETEKKVYELITRRFLAIFFPAAKYLNTQVAFIHPSGERFLINKKILIDEGYLKILKEKKETSETESKESINIENIKENAIYNATFHIKEGSTTAPKRYTSGNMIITMEHAGNFIEDEELRSQIKKNGIGTSATRAEILKKLYSIHYLSLNTKNQIITPTKEGELVYDIVKEMIPSLLSPTMTASWEKGLSQIESGEIKKQEYQEKVNQFIYKIVTNIKSVKTKDMDDEDVGVCPFCNGRIKNKGSSYACENNQNQESKCNFYIGGNIYKALSKIHLEELLQQGRTKELTLKNKEGKSYNAFITLTKEEKKLKLEFPAYESKELNLFCPKCNNTMKKYKSTYKCDCGFFVYHTISSVCISPSDMQTLFEGKRIKFTGFISKKQKKFDAYLTFDGEKLNMEF